MLKNTYTVDADGYIRFGDVARGELGMQCQYASFELAGIGERENLGADLNWKGDDTDRFPRTMDNGGNYHAIRITPDAADTFVARMNAKSHR